ncbi:MAG: Holliday junction resolvase RuvX [Acutalibacteraceae bacterium]|nr:Holliday junction resolvase RuvX [Acutalibacteraceae bacterium]
MKIMSVDLGLARTGIASCDSLELLASPVTVIFEKNEQRLIDNIVRLAHEQGAERIVVGLPKNMDGTSGERAIECERIAGIIAEKSGIDTVMWDERCTTVSAINALNVTNTRGKKRKAVIDAVAAVMILQSYLDYRRNKGDKG